MTRAAYSLPDASALGDFMMSQGWMMACAESCTGGLLAATLTDIPGSSAWFERGYVVYSNAAKMQALGVHPDTLERFGAVSEETAMEMAAGALSVCEAAHFAVSTTGIAGPGGATPGKPVGMVCFGFATRTRSGWTTRAETHVFEGDRQAVRLACVRFVVQRALQVLDPR
ncbi:CinA family protein [Pusillimonas sp. CC-YST705]|uniref:CinA family protein n=1 Tax=Mesopusillimonas faecipullorum TaxID=2755040 RepID=A0ABS8CCT7_9BURK|nr:CinA family protein [Mesopusillimonas faecipullorum]MCB5363429.1 CinA family protein [Mesopusillimonas faecipullorum]